MCIYAYSHIGIRNSYTYICTYVHHMCTLRIPFYSSRPHIRWTYTPVIDTEPAVHILIMSAPGNGHGISASPVNPPHMPLTRHQLAPLASEFAGSFF